MYVFKISCLTHFNVEQFGESKALHLNISHAFRIGIFMLKTNVTILDRVWADYCIEYLARG